MRDFDKRLTIRKIDAAQKMCLTRNRSFSLLKLEIFLLEKSFFWLHKISGSSTVYVDS